MNVLLKNITINDKNSSLNGKKVDLGVINGKITFDTKGKFSKEVDCTGAMACPGFLDMRAFMGEPGYEYKDDFKSMQHIASRGGYTAVAVLPNTQPVLDNKDALQNIISKSANALVKILPIASLSKVASGEELAEMIDLRENGAVAFSDGHRPIFHSDLMLKGLEYSQSKDMLIMNTPVDYHLSKKGYVNEGEMSTQLGMPGIPHLAEEIAIERDLNLLRYAGGRLHFSLITTEKGVKLIKNAKKEGLKVTCDIAAHYLAFDDTVLENFDTNHKVFPPYRTKKDIKALQKGLLDGTIDCIVSDHRPENIENKKLEFDKAEYGVSSIETTFSTVCTHSNLGPQEIIEKFAYQPRKILGLEAPIIEGGVEAEISIVDFSAENKMEIHSKSKNNALEGATLKGKVIGVINNKKSWFDEV